MKNKDKQRVKVKELLFSVDVLDGSYSINANKHLRRTIRGYLNKLDVPFHTGKVDVRDDACYELFYVDAQYEPVVIQLLKTYGQAQYVVMEDTDDSDLREMSSMNITGNSSSLKDLLTVQLIKSEAKDQYKTVFFDGKSKRYWAVIAQVEQAAA